MTDGPKNGPASASEPATRHLASDGKGPDQLWEKVPTNPMPPPGGFDAVEGPTLSSPSSKQDPPTVVLLEAKIQSLEQHLAETERELSEIYGAVEHLVKWQEATDRTMRQQRQGRFLMWGTMIAILAMLWLTLRSRLGILGLG